MLSLGDEFLWNAILDIRFVFAVRRALFTKLNSNLTTALSNGWTLRCYPAAKYGMSTSRGVPCGGAGIVQEWAHWGGTEPLTAVSKVSRRHRVSG
jgi:hypothetical protein